MSRDEAWVDRIWKGESMQVSKVLRKAVYGYIHWCPGCKELHYIQTTGIGGWSFDGNVDAPTFSPSVHVEPDDPTEECHYFVQKGQLIFCTQGTHHALKGQTMPMPPIPDEYADDSYKEHV